MDKRNDQPYLDFYNQLLHMLSQYIDEISRINYAAPEREGLKGPFGSPADLLEAIRVIMSSSIDLNRILEVAPDSFYVVNSTGKTLRANQAFFHSTGVSPDEVLGKNVYDLQKDGYFKPSVNGIALKGRHPVSIVQIGRNGQETIVTAVPFFDHEGKLLGSVSNAKLLKEINGIMSYMRDKKMESNKEAALKNEKLIANSEAMKNIVHLIEDIVNVDTSILITGETGVGKSLLTRYIHMCSKRNAYRLVEINCGAIPESLLESELFGYESGAFTGADKRGKPGLIELSDKGTIFFDEISELPLSLQVKLLHFIQSKKIIRVGGTKEIKVDARIVAASNKCLRLLMLKGEFRSDLYYRLNVIPIHIPSLRERPEDLAAAVEYFLHKYNAKHGKRAQLSEEKMQILLNYDWPGNLRELENYVERTVVTEKDYILSATGPDNEQAAREAFLQDPTDNVPIKKQNLSQILKDIEKEIIIKTYHKHSSSYKVAEELGISQASAHRRIKKYLKE